MEWIVIPFHQDIQCLLPSTLVTKTIKVNLLRLVDIPLILTT